MTRTIWVESHGLSDTFSNEGHEVDGSSTTEETPSSGDGVGSSDNVSRKRKGGPELGDHGSGANETDEEARGNPLGIGVRCTNQKTGMDKIHEREL